MIDNLTTEELEKLSRDADHLPSSPVTLSEISPLLDEIRRHRAAKSADADHVLEVVFDVCEDVLRSAGIYGWSRTIATRCANQIASSAPALSADDLRLIDRALGVLTSDYNDVPHDDIDRIRKMLAAHGAKP